MKIFGKLDLSSNKISDINVLNNIKKEDLEKLDLSNNIFNQENAKVNDLPNEL